MEHKTFDVEITRKADGGGRIAISTGALDRDRDRVFPAGCKLENYLKNPVVQWGHQTWEPWQTVGRSTAIEVEGERIVADFELRPAANDSDPQNIVRLLWDGGWIRAASIGFNPVRWMENPEGGRDYVEWELLEWSLVPLPANQDAIRLAAKALATVQAKESPAAQPSAGAETTAADDSQRQEPEAAATVAAANADELTPDEEDALGAALDELLNVMSGELTGA